jgi:HD-GYP domain-containing protein (c-di-GMP phosphodiesterase class II)
MGMAETDIPTIARGALLHDIGKIGISDQILFKPAGLTSEERAVMKQHVRLGYDMLRHIGFFHDALPVVLYHHEEYDGTGYPEGLVGDDIPQAARIFHVVDSYDALTQQRPYKTAWTHDDTLAELKRFAGVRYDPAVVAALERLGPEVTERIRNLRSFSPATRVLLGRAFYGRQVM